ncbi:hypothetical protein CBR_g23003 [Chara braunii]|uniref:Uncharacterized protein n=1 Tax=Chara braunii TaxID=69332 RepID=A0A388L3B2_CHABU|nr:hypothetical protein CBR_g23003 [Chara braunii]|eukprot:GBG76787.1 hypothetical protein CBR_g23003 [Chara braunii]
MNYVVDRLCLAVPDEGGAEQPAGTAASSAAAGSGNGPCSNGGSVAAGTTGASEQGNAGDGGNAQASTASAGAAPGTKPRPRGPLVEIMCNDQVGVLNVQYLLREKAACRDELNAMGGGRVSSGQSSGKRTVNGDRSVCSRDVGEGVYDLSEDPRQLLSQKDAEIAELRSQLQKERLLKITCRRLGENFKEWKQKNRKAHETRSKEMKNVLATLSEVSKNYIANLQKLTQRAERTVTYHVDDEEDEIEELISAEAALVSDFGGEDEEWAEWRKSKHRRGHSLGGVAGIQTDDVIAQELLKREAFNLERKNMQLERDLDCYKSKIRHMEDNMDMVCKENMQLHGRDAQQRLELEEALRMKMEAEQRAEELAQELASLREEMMVRRTMEQSCARPAEANGAQSRHTPPAALIAVGSAGGMLVAPRGGWGLSTPKAVVKEMMSPAQTPAVEHVEEGELLLQGEEEEEEGSCASAGAESQRDDHRRAAAGGVLSGNDTNDTLYDINPLDMLNNDATVEMQGLTNNGPGSGQAASAGGAEGEVESVWKTGEMGPAISHHDHGGNSHSIPARQAVVTNHDDAAMDGKQPPPLRAATGPGPSRVVDGLNKRHAPRHVRTDSAFSAIHSPLPIASMLLPSDDNEDGCSKGAAEECQDNCGSVEIHELVESGTRQADIPRGTCTTAFVECGEVCREGVATDRMVEGATSPGEVDATGNEASPEGEGRTETSGFAVAVMDSAIDDAVVVRMGGVVGELVCADDVVLDCMAALDSCDVNYDISGFGSVEVRNSYEKYLTGGRGASPRCLIINAAADPVSESSGGCGSGSPSRGRAERRNGLKTSRSLWCPASCLPEDCYAGASVEEGDVTYPRPIICYGEQSEEDGLHEDDARVFPPTVCDSVQGRWHSHREDCTTNSDGRASTASTLVEILVSPREGKLLATGSAVGARTCRDAPRKGENSLWRPAHLSSGGADDSREINEARDRRIYSTTQHNPSSLWVGNMPGVSSVRVDSLAGIDLADMSVGAASSGLSMLPQRVERLGDCEMDAGAGSVVREGKHSEAFWRGHAECSAAGRNRDKMDLLCRCSSLADSQRSPEWNAEQESMHWTSDFPEAACCQGEDDRRFTSLTVSVSDSVLMQSLGEDDDGASNDGEVLIGESLSGAIPGDEGSPGRERQKGREREPLCPSDPPSNGSSLDRLVDELLANGHIGGADDVNPSPVCRKEDGEQQCSNDAAWERTKVESYPCRQSEEYRDHGDEVCMDGEGSTISEEERDGEGQYEEVETKAAGEEDTELLPKQGNSGDCLGSTSGGGKVSACPGRTAGTSGTVNALLSAGGMSGYGWPLSSDRMDCFARQRLVLGQVEAAVEEEEMNKVYVLLKKNRWKEGQEGADGAVKIVGSSSSGGSSTDESAAAVVAAARAAELHLNADGQVAPVHFEDGLDSASTITEEDTRSIKESDISLDDSHDEHDAEGLGCHTRSGVGSRVAGRASVLCRKEWGAGGGGLRGRGVNDLPKKPARRIVGSLANGCLPLGPKSKIGATLDASHHEEASPLERVKSGIGKGVGSVGHQAGRSVCGKKGGSGCSSVGHPSTKSDRSCIRRGYGGPPRTDERKGVGAAGRAKLPFDQVHKVEGTEKRGRGDAKPLLGVGRPKRSLVERI